MCTCTSSSWSPFCLEIPPQPTDLRTEHHFPSVCFIVPKQPASPLQLRPLRALYTCVFSPRAKGHIFGMEVVPVCSSERQRNQNGSFRHDDAGKQKVRGTGRPARYCQQFFQFLCQAHSSVSLSGSLPSYLQSHSGTRALSCACTVPPSHLHYPGPTPHFLGMNGRKEEILGIFHLETFETCRK